MIIRKYVVNNMNEALTRIRYELGKDAIIISQRRVRKPGFIGLFSKKMIEVTAAIESIKKDNNIDNDMHKSIETIKKIVIDNEKDNNKIDDSNRTKIDEKNLIKEVQEMKAMLNELKSASKIGEEPKNNIFKLLKECDFDDKYINQIINKIVISGVEYDDKLKIEEIIKDMINISCDDLKGNYVFVGPTGVGKTTTIAKLAGKLALVDNKKVGLITIDTYRIGAVEQLKTYADIMNIPFSVVINIKEMEAAIESMKDCEVILVDTTGRSSKNVMQISELRAFINKIKSSNIYLVISSTTKNKDIQIIAEGYRILNYNKVIITKLDETTTYGSIFNILNCAKKPLSFITFGQNVPDDIKIMNSEEITKLVLGEDKIC